MNHSHEPTIYNHRFVPVLTNNLSCDNCRRSDTLGTHGLCRGPVTDVTSRISIGVIGMPTRDTPKRRLSLSIPSVPMPTLRAVLRSISWVNKYHGNASEF